MEQKCPVCGQGMRKVPDRVTKRVKWWPKRLHNWLKWYEFPERPLFISVATLWYNNPEFRDAVRRLICEGHRNARRLGYTSYANDWVEPMI